MHKMTDVSLAELLATVELLPGDADEGSFAVCAIPGFAHHYVGRNSVGNPCLLLGSGPGPFHAPVRLAMMDARFGNRHQIHPVDGVEREELLSVITCRSPDEHIQSYFLHVCGTILNIVGSAPSLRDIVQAVQQLIALFRRLSQPATRSLNGLLGELIVIANSRDARSAVAAWRCASSDRFDFSIDDVRLDVKTSAERRRIHHLTTEQCQPPNGTVGLLASLFLEISGGGQSLGQLVSEIETSLTGDIELILKLYDTISDTLGDSLPTALDVRFDDRLALESLRIYDLREVPAIRNGIPPEVSAVRFRSDITAIGSLIEDDVMVLSQAALVFLPPSN